MNLEKRIKAFVELGKFLGQFSIDRIEKNDKVASNDLFFDGFKQQIKSAHNSNGWFTEDNVLKSVNNWSKLLNKSNFTLWINKYHFNNKIPKKVAIIMAGNIPLVGFHDFLSVLISGHNVLVKQSSNDKDLLPYISKYLEHIEPEFQGKIEFTEKKLENFDAVIATGSNNTARYFEYYFKNKPSIIRNNRNSVAVLNGKETKAQLEALSEDIFRYYGLGCRSVSKLYVPKGYDFDNFFNAIYHWHPIINEAKYANNYDYNKAIYLMSEFDMLDNGFLMIKEDSSFASPIATVFYEYYNSVDEIKKSLKAAKENIQCIMSQGLLPSEVNFGQTQHPNLGDYADGIDTVDFLLKI